MLPSGRSFLRRLVPSMSYSHQSTMMDTRFGRVLSRHIIIQSFSDQAVILPVSSARRCVRQVLSADFIIRC
jgi:hypothetical protein